MRKLVVFLLVFGIGAAILWMVEARRRAAEAPATPGASAAAALEVQPATEPPPAGVDEAAPPPAQAPGDAGASEELQVPEETQAPEERADRAGAQDPDELSETQIEVSGEVQFTVFDDETGLKRYTFQAQLEPQEGGLYQARELRVESFDPADGTLAETVVAERGEVRIEWSEAATEARLGENGRIQLFDVTVTQEAGGPLAPMTLRTPSLLAEVERGTYRSAPGEPVEVLGRGFSAEGEDVTLDTRAGRLLLENGGRFRFVAEDGRSATFSTDAGEPLLLQRVGVAADGAFEASAERGGLLLFEGDAPGRVAAQSIRLFGRSSGKAVLLERGRAEGRVEAERGRDRFTGGSATLRFDAVGAVTSLVLEDSPTWTVLLEGVGAEPLTLEGSGEGPLTTSFQENRFELVGRSLLRVPEQDLEMRAQAGMGGTLGSGRREGVFEARGDVRATRGDVLLETSLLEAEFRIEGERTTTFVCNEQTRIEGPDGKGTTLILNAADGLTATLRGDQWRVPEARGVRLSAIGGEAFEASAGTLRELDWANRTGIAEDGVRYRSELGEGEAVRAVAKSAEEWSLYGLPGAPARFRVRPPQGEGAVGTFEALSIDLTQRRIDAREAVRAEIRATDRTYRAESETATFTLEDPVEGNTPFTYAASRVREASAEGATDKTGLASDQLVVRGSLFEEDAAVAGGERRVEASELLATGRVRLDHEGKVDVGGAGERFQLQASGLGRLETGPGQRVSAWGVLPGSGQTYELTAESMDFEAEAVRAHDPHIFVDATLLPISPTGLVQRGFTEARARELRADELGVLLEGEVEVRGTDRRGMGLAVDAGTVLLASGEKNAAGERGLDSVEAWGGFEATYEGNAYARGERFSARREWAAIDGSPAIVEISGYALESTRIEADLENFLVTTERGVMRAAEDKGAWALEFASMRPALRDGETLMTIASPVYTAIDNGARADWAVFWLDGERWRERGRQKLFAERPKDEERPDPPLPERDLVPNVFRRLSTGALAEHVHAVYMEGEVEVTEEGRRAARGDALYLDLQDNVGTITGAEIVFAVGLGDDKERLRTRAQEIHTAADGTLRAADATLTACDHDEPHYVIGTGKLVLDPREDGTWRFSARDNMLQVKDGVQFPLPSIGKLVLDDSGGVEGFETAEGEVMSVESVALASTPRFGTALSTHFRTDLGRFGRAIGSLLGFEREVRGRWEHDVAWLGSRGPLLTSGIELREKTPRAEGEELWLDVYGSAIYDTGSDRGLIDVDEDDRDEFRRWGRARGRYPFSDKSWLDLAWSAQNDAAVQSEFFEDEFLNYEQRDTYLHWRRASGANYADAMAKTRVDDFRTDIERLPSAGLYAGETQVAQLGAYPLLYGASVDVDVMRRRAGDFGIEDGQIVDNDGDELGQDDYDSFDLFNDRLEEVFLDGLGNRKAVRADTVQRLSVPMDLGLGGIKATPFLDGRFTAWDKGVDEDDSPTRAGLFGGVELATTLWRIDEYGFDNVISPSVRIRNDLASDTSDGTPVIFDEADENIEGTEIDAGVRTRWWRAGEENQLDLELRGLHRYGRAGDLDDTTEILVLGDLRSHVENMPIGVRHDARYDVDKGLTIYSRSVFAIAPTDDLVLELGYNRGVNQDEEQLFEAAGLAARFRATPKWEFELKEVFAIKGGGNLNNKVTVRRFSHDFVLEFSVQNRSGEGGTGFTLNFLPLLGWKANRLGLLDPP